MEYAMKKTDTAPIVWNNRLQSLRYQHKLACFEKKDILYRLHKNQCVLFDFKTTPPWCQSTRNFLRFD